jgi:hypothetical protein
MGLGLHSGAETATISRRLGRHIRTTLSRQFLAGYPDTEMGRSRLEMLDDQELAAIIHTCDRY